MTLFRDEQGHASSMRVLLYVTFLQFVAMIWATAFGARFDAAAWPILGTLLTVLTIGAFGPRMAQYLGPQLGAAIGGMTTAVSTVISKRYEAHEWKDGKESGVL